MASSTRKIVLEVTQDQLDMLEGFYTACGMDFQPRVLPSSSSDAQEEGMYDHICINELEIIWYINSYKFKKNAYQYQKIVSKFLS